MAGQQGHSSSALAGQLRFGLETCQLPGSQGAEGEDKKVRASDLESVCQSNTNTWQHLCQASVFVLIKGLNQGEKAQLPLDQFLTL